MHSTREQSDNEEQAPLAFCQKVVVLIHTRIAGCVSKYLFGNVYLCVCMTLRCVCFGLGQRV